MTTTRAPAGGKVATISFPADGLLPATMAPLPSGHMTTWNVAAAPLGLPQRFVPAQPHALPGPPHTMPQHSMPHVTQPHSLGVCTSLLQHGLLPLSAAAPHAVAHGATPGLLAHPAGVGPGGLMPPMTYVTGAATAGIPMPMTLAGGVAHAPPPPPPPAAAAAAAMLMQHPTTYGPLSGVHSQPGGGVVSGLPMSAPFPLPHSGVLASGAPAAGVSPFGVLHGVGAGAGAGAVVGGVGVLGGVVVTSGVDGGHFAAMHQHSPQPQLLPMTHDQLLAHGHVPQPLHPVAAPHGHPLTHPHAHPLPLPHSHSQMFSAPPVSHAALLGHSAAQAPFYGAIDHAALSRGVPPHQWGPPPR